MLERTMSEPGDIAAHVDDLLQKLRWRRDVLSAEHRTNSDRVQSLIAEEQRLLADKRARVARHPTVFREGHPDFEKYDQRAGETRAERRTWDERTSKSKVRFDEINRGLDRFSLYVDRHRSSLKRYSGPDPVLRRNETDAQAIERAQRRVRELRADLHRVNSAPLTAAEAKQRLAAELDALAEAGQPDVGLVLEDRVSGEIAWPVASEVSRAWCRTSTRNSGASRTSHVDTLALFAWLNRKTLLKALEAEIDEIADDANALTDDECARKIVEIQSDILAAEREESFWFWTLIDRDDSLVPRADIDPRALLGLANDMPALVED